MCSSDLFHSAELVMLVRIHRVDADSYTMGSCGFYFFCIDAVDHGAVGAQHNHEFSVGGVTDDLVNVRSKKRFAAGEDQKRVGVDLGNLVDHPETFFGVEFIGFEAATKVRIEIAVGTIEVAPLGEVP
mgnify:FL=1